jgi:hypothetical protein
MAAKLEHFDCPQAIIASQQDRVNAFMLRQDGIDA